ncbi:hypothetical protein NW763_008192 [Fusarium oxysporum]|nr:hypothetical protein NW763_008192 [Fusarium oxysporum]
MQKVFGKRMIVNEDRRLTTNLLVRGWGVVFASDVLTATETPTTVTRWLRSLCSRTSSRHTSCFTSATRICFFESA